jgi:hypothetical protein
MRYAVVWSAEADSDFDRIAARHPLVASRILDEVDKLAENPIGLSRPPAFPHPLMPKYQFWANTQNGRCQITILFQYADDEQRIVIRGIGILEVDDAE